MAHVIRAYKPVEQLPSDLAQLQAAYRTVLHGKRALLLFDNAGGRTQIEPLLAPPNCLLLFTSRNRFTLPGLHALNIDSLPLSDGETLLLKIAPRIGKSAADLARLCGGLPLALRLTGSALAEREDLDPDEFARRLQAEQARVEMMDASLELSYDLLTPKLQRLWRLLAVFPSSFDAASAALVWGLKPDPTSDCLGELLRYSLVEYDKELKRYRLHDLVRLAANEGLDAAEGESARQRYARQFEDVSAVVGEFHDRDHFDETIGNEKDLKIAREKGDRRREADVLADMGWVDLTLGNARQAIGHLEQSLQIFRDLGNRKSETVLLMDLGIAHAELLETRRATEYYEQALVVAREIGDRGREAHTLYRKALALDQLGDHEAAIALAEDALRLWEQLSGSEYSVWAEDDIEKLRPLLAKWKGHE